VEGNEPDHTGVTTKTVVEILWPASERKRLADEPYRTAELQQKTWSTYTAEQIGGSPAPENDGGAIAGSNTKQASLLTELGHREHLGYRARSYNKRERIPSATCEMTMEQSISRVTDQRRYARY
jgi:hypothetical protein